MSFAPIKKIDLLFAESAALVAFNSFREQNPAQRTKAKDGLTCMNLCALVIGKKSIGTKLLYCDNNLRASTTVIIKFTTTALFPITI